MKLYVFIKHTIKSRIIALHTIQQQLHSRTNCSSSHYSHYTTHPTCYKITESQCLSVVQNSLSLISSSQATCPYESSCHLKGVQDAIKPQNIA